MKRHPTCKITITATPVGSFRRPPAELLDFVEHPKHGALLVDYKSEDRNGRFFCYKLSPAGGGGDCFWLALPPGTRTLILKEAVFEAVHVE